MHCLIAYSVLADIAAKSDVWSKWLDPVWSKAWPILLLAFGLGMLIFVHELGHFLAAKLVGIKVEVFALGFGPRLLGFTRGETDYRVSAVPLGGYIKMLGQDDLDPTKRVDDKRAFCNKSVGQRFIVIAAGVVMNIICALALFVILFRFTGVNFQRPEVGIVMSGSPAQLAGVMPGDTVLAVDGKHVRDFGELSSRIALTREGQKTFLELSRPGVAEPFTVAVVPDYLPPQKKIRTIGISASYTLTVAEPRDYAGPGELGLEKGDVVLGLFFDRQPHYYQKYYQFSEAINSRRDKPTAIIATRDGRELEPITVLPHLLAGSHVMGLIPPSRVAAVQPKSPAEKVDLKPGDVIVSFDQSPWPNFARITEITSENEGKELPITILRAGKRMDLLIAPRRKGHKEGALGIVQEADYQSLFVSGLAEGSVLADQEIEIPLGAELLKLDGLGLANWSDLIGKLRERAGRSVKLQYAIDGKKRTASFVVPSADSSVWTDDWRFYIDLATAPEEITVKGDTLGEAVYIGLHKTWFWIQSLYTTLTGLARGDVKTDALAGPVGIARISFHVATDRGTAHFFYLMAIIGVNLAIVNFLPIPVMDGGHALFLLVEKIKGSPVSLRIQSVATAIGLAAIAALFLLLTFQDIMSWIAG